MLFNATEFQEKTRLKRAKKTSSRLPILVTEKQTMEYGKKVDKTYSYVKRDEKTFVYLGKKTYSIPFFSEIGSVISRFHITWVDLVSPQDLLDLQDEDFQAFGVFLPKNIILEVLEFHKNHRDEFSSLVKQYPFSHLIFSQWLTIKLYEKHKELTKNPNLQYEEFLKNFTFTFNHKIYNIFNALSMLKAQEFNYKNDEEFNIIDTLTALDSSSSSYITLYDFIYDIIPNSIRKVFLKDIETMQAYLPLKQERFFYQEIEYNDPKEVFLGLYGSEKTYNKSKVPKEYYQILALHLKDYTIEPLIPKAKSNQFGIGYDELWELVSKNEEDLEYPEIWEFGVEFVRDEILVEAEEGQGAITEPIYKMIIKEKHKASYEDIIRVSNSNTNVSYIGRYAFKTLEDDEKTDKMIDKQYYEAKALLLQNNFHTKYLIFESLRTRLRGDEKFREETKRWNLLFGTNIADNPLYWESCIVGCGAFITYRFNQALALAFLNAYAPNKT